ncbi:MAG: radical SAM protein [Planctomycetes bacterium]|nr:radical SAM protein [Planctomycetota bacterium]
MHDHRAVRNRKNVLLTSVFGPFSRDDEFGSRSINPMELYHNQVTRAQGPFSLRMSHRSWGIQLIQHNISAPSTLLDFPTRDRYIKEISGGRHDIIGISGIIANVKKVSEMCRLARVHSPKSTVVVGGHVCAIPEINDLVDADYVVRGEGVRWMRQFLGEDAGAPIAHPALPSSFGFRLMGIPIPRGGGAPAATIVCSVGCPMGCNFCTTSAFFGGKGKVTHFYEKGAELFKVMENAEKALGVSSFFIMDENFLLYQKRALELLDCMKAGGKAWSLYVFSSANAIAKYSMRQLVELGVSWVWIGLESPNSKYNKLASVDTLQLTNELRAHGIRVHGSTIVGLEHHTPESVGCEIDYAVSHEAECHQFMLYTPVPGTELYAEIARAGRLLPDVDLADIHGQYKFNFEHPAISRDESKVLLDNAFRYDYERNGPSLYRIIRTMWNGWNRYKSDPDARVRARFIEEGRQLAKGYGATLWAMEKYLKNSNQAVSARIRKLRLDMENEFGFFSRWLDRTVGPILLWSAKREARRFPDGRPIEPRTFVDRLPGRAPALSV